MKLIEIIKKALKAVWEFIKKIFLRILNFLKNIAGFFKDASRLKKLKENSNAIAVAIKEKLESGNYNVVNCLFDKQEGELIDYEEDCIINQAEKLDNDTIIQFGDKDMLILE